MYIDENLIKNFLNLVSKRSSLSGDASKVYINAAEIFDVFGISNDNSEFDSQDLENILKKVNNKNIGIKALSANEYTTSFSHQGKDVSIDTISDCSAPIDGVLFAVNTQTLAKKLRDYQVPKEKFIPKPQTKELTLYLSPTGDLWREPKKKYCYQMMEAKGRLNIVKLLAKHQTKTDGYFGTKELAATIGKSVEYVKSEKGKINRATQANLKLKLMDGKQGSGYRINPALKIKILPR